MLRFLKQLFCRHTLAFRYNLYGDQIIAHGWKRSLWRCTKCGVLKGKDQLHREGCE